MVSVTTFLSTLPSLCYLAKQFAENFVNGEAKNSLSFEGEGQGEGVCVSTLS
jgi:hypothetical protein